MYKLFAFLVVASLASANAGLRFRRQSNDGADQAQPVSPGSTTAAAPSTISEADLQQCIRDCPVTAEYNPVCGTNRVTYPNPGRLLCAQACGVSVNLLRTSPCPAN
ncbi:unnamed protein product, partial [Iphiclides podalirius]